MPTPTTIPIPRLWLLRAALTGVLAVGLGALLCTANYVALPGALEDLDWAVMPWAIALFVLVSGVSIGAGLGGATLFAARRGAGPVGLMAAGAVGGLMAGVAPGILGIAGFGSLPAPYAGTANILGASLLGAIAFVAFWSPQLFPHRQRPLLVHLVHAAVASVVSLGAFGMIAWSLVRTLGWVPTLDPLRHAANAVGLVSFAVGVGALLTALGGAAIGGACALVGRMSR